MKSVPAKPLWQLSAIEIAHRIRTGSTSSEDVINAHLQRLADVNPALNAVVVERAEAALREAQEADRLQASGATLGPLHGVPVAVKVNTDLASAPNTNGVEALKDVVAPADNPCLKNLKDAGAIVIGQTNTPAYSMRWHTDNELHGQTLNPWSAAHTSGGSSGGASSAVAAGIAPIAHGNDIAGSIRYPAFCCGLVGVRPSHGRVPSFNPSAPGARPISAQFMAVQGPLTRTVADARLALAVMSAGDPNDTRWVDTPLVGPAIPEPRRVALVVNPAGRGVTDAIAASTREAGDWLTAAGYAVEEVEPPELGYVADLWARIGMDDVIRLLEPEVAAHGDPGIQHALGLWRKAHPVKGPQSVIDALQDRDRVLRLWQLFLEDYPLVVMPSSTIPPFAAGIDAREFEDFERIWNAQLPQLALPVLGLPGIAVGTGVSDGLPLGVQIISRRFREDWCLDAAEVIESRAGISLPIDPRP